jgi:imidazolonepropionase-like amidohydrolase
MSRFRRFGETALAILAIGWSISASGPPAQAQQDAAVLLQNVRIFDAKSDVVSGASNVLIRNHKIEKISTAAIVVDTAQTMTLNGGGRVLMPGLIDAHWHAMLIRATPVALLESDVGYTNLVAAAEASDTLMRGFTTVRDMGGPSFGLKRAIDEGLVPGPRIYPSGAMITITGGQLSRMEQIGGSMVVDSPDEVRVRAREQLMQGATQVKLTAGGGVSSPFSPIDVSTFTEPELRAAVDGNPIDNIKLIEEPAKNFILIMKDGKIYKNLLASNSKK